MYAIKSERVKTMKMNKGALIVALLLVSASAVSRYASSQPFDPRNQIVSYNPQNTTVINSAVGYTTTGI